MPAAARAYEGALGNVIFDANGDLSSPASYAAYRLGAGGEWVAAPGREAPPAVCGVALGSPAIAFGDVGPGETSGTALQAIAGACTA